jgi:hypothetical protein
VARPPLCLEPLPLFAQNSSSIITQPFTNDLILMLPYSDNKKCYPLSIST